MDLGITEYKSITKYHKYDPDPKDWLRIEFKHRGKGNRLKKVICTKDHKFFVNNRWIEARELKKNDKLSHLNKTVSYEMKQLILGCLLGDSSILNRDSSDQTEKNRCRNIIFSQSIVQKEYFDYKKQLFGNMFHQFKSAKGGYEGSKEILRGSLSSTDSLSDFIIEHCEGENGKRLIKKSWVDQLTPVSIAFWFMDDGALQHRDSNKQNPRAYFFTNRYSREEINLLIEMFKTKYDISSKILESPRTKGPILFLDVKSTEILSALIFPYVCKSMKYKLPKKYENTPCVYENYQLENTAESIWDVEIINIFEVDKTDQPQYYHYSYDLTIEDNHNYFANGVLVHNCSSTFFVKDGEFGVCSRNLELKETDDNVYWEIARRYELKEKLLGSDMICLPKNVCIQGEIIGPKIQKNKYGFVKWPAREELQHQKGTKQVGHEPRNPVRLRKEHTQRVGGDKHRLAQRPSLLQTGSVPQVVDRHALVPFHQTQPDL